MIPIPEQLSRIRCDPEFGGGKFIIGYCDRIKAQIVNGLARTVAALAGESRGPARLAIGAN